MVNKKKYTLKEVIKILESKITIKLKTYREVFDGNDYDFSSFIIGYIKAIKTLTAYNQADIENIKNKEIVLQQKNDDRILQFLEKVKKSSTLIEIYNVYTVWCLQNKYPPLCKINFARQLEKKKFLRCHGARNVVYVTGVAINYKREWEQK